MTAGALSPYRALDLSDEKGPLCGKILADLGADVIKVERPSGDPSRRIGPFYHDIPHPERSLYWWAFNTNKRSITLELETQEGRQRLKKLVDTAHFLVESFPPGYLDSLGLGYNGLSEINPKLIMVSITPFGQTGPYKDLKGFDLTMLAMGGLLYISGDEDRPPVRFTVPQAYLHAGCHAAAGAMIAHYHRQRTGEGQHVDVSIQACIARTLFAEPYYWKYNGHITRRHGQAHTRMRLALREIWPCKDGFVGFKLVGGQQRRNRALVAWIEEEGIAGVLKDVDWETKDLGQVTTAEMSAWEKTFVNFFSRHTKTEIYREAKKRDILTTPANTPAEVLHLDQLQARDFWVEVEHPELSSRFVYPGAPYKLSETPWRLSQRAPSIGEHNQEVFEEISKSELGLEDMAKRRTTTPGLRPLEGLKVLDFSTVVAGPFLTMYLADFGAEVIKVESQEHLDTLRRGPYIGDVPNPNHSLSFFTGNSSKRSLGLNLNKPRAVDIVKKLVSWSDVVVENFTPGVMERRGLSYQALKKIKSDIIVFSGSLQGQTGPNRGFAGFGWNVNALAGVSHVSGWPDRPGISPHAAYSDAVAPWYGVVAVLAALDHRDRTGQGQYVDQSQLEAVLTFMCPMLLDYTVNGREQVRMGNRSAQAAPHGVFPCKGEDRWVAIAICTDKEWKAFCGAMGDLEWSLDPRFATLASRKENEDELEQLVGTWTLQFSPEEVMALMQAVGVAVGVVQDVRDLVDRDPQLRYRGFFDVIDHRDVGPMMHVGLPIILSKTPAHRQAAPALGEHNEYICNKILGMSDEEFAELVATGVLECV